MFGNKKINLDDQKIKKSFKDIVLVIKYLHDSNLAHCDIKPQNILKKDDMPKLADFGSLA